MASKAKHNALLETLKSNSISDDERKIIQKSLDETKWYTWGSKAALFIGLAMLIDWKKPARFTQREFPLAVGAVASCLAIDYFISEYFWAKNQKVVKRVTGFNGEVYVSGQAMKNMKSMYKAKQQTKKQANTQDDLLHDDD